MEMDDSQGGPTVAVNLRPLARLCDSCKTVHVPPRGKFCTQVDLFDDLPSDEEDDTSPECNVNPEPQGAGPDTQQLLSSMLEKLDVMNSNVTAIGTRVGELEKSNKKSTKKPSKLTLAGLDSGLRSRMQALDIRVNEEDSDSEDQWEVAGAGAANPVKDKPDKTGKKLVSGAVLASQDDVLVQFDFPHKHVPITVARPKPTALDLTLPEFIYGYTDMMRDHDLDQETRFQMMDLLIILMDDAFTRPWPSVRHFGDTGHGTWEITVGRHRQD